jgi:hypothetical protein
MQISDRGGYNDCIGAASKLDMIQAMIESIDACSAISNDDYNKCIEAQDILYEVSKIMASKAKEFIDGGIDDG